MKLTFQTALLLLSVSYVVQAQNPRYAWICDEDKACQRKLRSELNATMRASATPMNVCKLTCDNLASLWPKPTGTVTISKDLIALLPENITLSSVTGNPAPVQPMLNQAFQIFKGYLEKLHGGAYPVRDPAKQNKLVITFQVTDGNTHIGLSTNESYTLTVSTAPATKITTATISAATFFGARHGLETLSQLIVFNEELVALQMVSSASVVDKPVFRYRGIMLDTSRNYLSLAKIKKVIDGMSYTKLNILHWHITDSQSWPLEVPSRPKMLEYGAHTADKIYRKTDVIDLVQYARQRGVKIIPELDQPAHSGYGYQWGAEDGLGDLVVCLNKEPWHEYCVQPNCGQLNIVNPNVPIVVGDILKDMMTMFDKDIFHLGGDEVDFRCYNSTKETTDWMTQNNYNTSNTEDFYRLWGGFQDKVLNKLFDATGDRSTQAIMWTSGITDPSRIGNYLSTSQYIIQIWSPSDDPAIGGVLDKGYRTIFSNVDGMYLDCGFPAWIGSGLNWCAPIKGWQTMYDNNPEKIYAGFTNASAAAAAVQSGQILGSETPLWAEQVDDSVVESRVFPRAAAHAERTWSHPNHGYAPAEIRMVTNRARMAARGIIGDNLQEEYCLQHEGKCYAPRPPTENGGEEPAGNEKNLADIQHCSALITIISLSLLRFL